MSAGGSPPGSRLIEPEVRTLAARLTHYAESDRERAIEIYRFVRDEIRFGFTRDFYSMTPAQTIAAGIGYSMTKGELFATLLEAAGVPARLRFVDIRADILRGLMNPGTTFLDHVYTEVLIDGKWLGVDSYIIDAKLYDAAKVRLDYDNAELGYGVHRHGVDYWDGEYPSFVQWVNDGSVEGLTSKDFGGYQDVATFYSQCEDVWNRKFFAFGLLFAGSARSANRRADQMRHPSP